MKPTEAKPLPHEITESPAYSVLRASSRRVLDRILTEIERGGGVASISNEAFDAYRCSSVAPALRELTGLGFVEITAGRNRCNSFAGSDRWRAITSKREASIISAVAREPRPRPPPKPVASKPDDTEKRRQLRIETAKIVAQEPRKPSMPVLDWPSEKFRDA